MFYISSGIALLFVVWGVFFSESMEAFNAAAMSAVTGAFGWVYLMATTLFIVFLVFLALSRFGRIRLGKDDDRPEFSTGAWLAMLFSAGMGIGLVFYGVAEPMTHFAAPPPFGASEGGTPEAGRLAMQYTFFHWGLHAWAIYGLVALALAYFQFRKGARGLISSAFYPLLGDRVNGPIGKAIDVLAIFVTALGVATSFGIGATQINSGMNFVFGVPENIPVQVVIIVVVMLLFLTSAVSGLNRGIRYLSNTNIALFVALMLFVLVLGPGLFILRTFTESIGNYLQNFLTMSFNSGAFTSAEGETWLQGWTIFYWAWWMMWVMWVGTFIARISKGRTIREFVAGVLLVPCLFSFLWFSVMGGAALDLDLSQGADIGAAVADNINTALFVTLDEFPFGTVVSVVAMILIATFFITSADSAAFVLAMLSTDGNQNPGWRIKVMWGVFVAFFAFVLLLAGGLEAVQQVAIITGVPFTILLIGMGVSLYKAVSEEVLPERGGGADPSPDGRPVSREAAHSKSTVEPSRAE
ncbi:BCCT family transporter [Geodermatophilus sp. YIM 151500]|uniref:glycine betaine uptake BCCT transporter n=1 Tax=Geodermatophilus sp. YIM 151500 TaxID=2984531 RepID=UPI0021E3F8D3|nr:BCCT family transporter [Geodermatophilus sp. YIM 151500]MCV2489778.1 BCCT family transporter [Geodermatophilus sp. YIM 151500]